MAKEKLVAIDEIHITKTPGKAGTKTTPAKPPVVDVIAPGRSFMADGDVAADLKKKGAAKAYVAPNSEDDDAEKKPAAKKPAAKKPAAKKPAEKPAEKKADSATDESAKGGADDGSDLV